MTHTPTPSGVDSRHLGDFIDDYLQGVARAVLDLSRPEIEQAVLLLAAACHARRRVYVFGNGGSAATASHMVNDLNKQALVADAPAMRAQSLNDNVPLLTAWSNDEDYAAAFQRQLRNFLEPDDVVVAISTSGNSPNVVRAVELARREGAHVIAMTGDVGGALAGLADCCLCVPSPDIGQQEDVHLVLNHVLALGVRNLLTSL